MWRDYINVALMEIHDRIVACKMRYLVVSRWMADRVNLDTIRYIQFKGYIVLIKGPCVETLLIQNSNSPHMPAIYILAGLKPLCGIFLHYK